MTIKQKQKLLENYVIENKNNLYRTAYSYSRNKDDALDIIQESIYKALKTIENINNIDSLKTWFYSILVHTAIDYLRKNKKYILEDDFNSFFEQSHNDKYEDIDLKNTLNRLPSEQKTVVMLRYFNDLKIHEIADILDENLSTVKSRLYKGLKNLKLEMTAQEEIL